MRYITFQEAARRLNIAEEKLLRWAQEGYLSIYATKSAKSVIQPAGSKYLSHTSTYQTNLTLYCRADEIEELAEDLSWSRLGLHSLARDKMVFRF